MELKIGEKINFEGGKTARIEKELGRGGQGIVYAVSLGRETLALKWYACKFADKKKFRENLQKNIERGAPSNKFLWPRFLTEEKGGTFGYAMDLRPRQFSDFSDILNNKAKFASTRKSLDVALNLVKAFRDLHNLGLSYQDLNDGGFFIDTQTGEVFSPIPDDERLGFGMTTSLCGENALNDFRIAFGFERLAGIFVMSDGVADSFSPENLAKFIAKTCKNVSLDCQKTQEALQNFLPRLSAEGSGDDVSIAGIVKNAKHKGGAEWA